MRISLLQISLLQFFKTITKIWLMQFYGLFMSLMRTYFWLMRLFPGPKSSIRQEPSVHNIHMQYAYRPYNVKFPDLPNTNYFVP